MQLQETKQLLQLQILEIYFVTVLDANGCSGVESFILNPPTAITSSTSETQTSCANTNDGSSTITVTGGLAPYNLSWTGPSSDNPAGDEITIDGGALTLLHWQLEIIQLQ